MAQSKTQTRLDFATVDVFTRIRYEGNPLGIVKLPASVSITQEQKQVIAREFNLSETVFLHEAAKAGENEWRLDIFVTHTEIPFAGHPTIGSACYALGKVAADTGATGILTGIFRAKAGRIDLSYDVGSGFAKAEIPHNFRVHAAPVSNAELRKLQPAVQNFPEKAPVASIVNGMTFVLVPLASLEELGRVKENTTDANPPLDEGWSGRNYVGQYHYFIEESGAEVTKVRTRMLVRGIEDPATGSAASALSVFLSNTQGKKAKNVFEITQGVEMGRKSLIGVEVLFDGAGEVQKVTLSGTAVEIMSGSLNLP